MPIHESARHLAIEGARRLPGVGRLSFLLLSNLLFTALIAALALHFVLLWRFGSALDGKLLSLISEPGRAANWLGVGHTKGRGRMDRHFKADVVTKAMFLYPLVKDAASRLQAR